ncbi:MAG: hypothetical protein AAGC77_10480 [Pseudomonadota bacterium]
MSLKIKSTAHSVVTVMGKTLLFPGEYVCDRLGIEDQDSRYLLRMFVNLTVYGKVALLILLPFV